MIQMIKRLLEFSGNQRGRIIESFVFSLLDSVFETLPIMAILIVLTGVLSALSGGVMPSSTIWVSFSIMAAGIV
ncbi:MAG: ABC transporter ATP-binding protein, partial [Lachnospiraceae bacterium]|nr:ABC transporter ATP-binding protein [Lachnospiraceae bacterium]